MELRHFRYFVAVAEELHFGRAAARLHVVQPALSKQVMNLERELGVKLLYRTKREVRLTEAGRLFLEEAKKVLEHAERAVSTVNRAAKGEVGQLQIGFITPATLSVLPSIVRVFRERYPDVELVLSKLTTAEQVEALHDGRIRVGFLREPSYHEDADLASKTILREPLVLALPEAHPFAATPRVPLSVLANEPFIMFSRSREPGLHEKYMQAFQDAGFTPKIAQETVHIQAILGFVAEGLGLSLTPASFQNMGRCGVVYRELQGPTPEIELAVAWRRDSPLPVLRTFLNIIDEIYGSPAE